MKAHGTTLSDDVITFRLLESSNISEYQKQLVRAAATEFNFKEISSAMGKIFGNKSVSSDDLNMSDSIIKTEPINHASHMQRLYALDTPANSAQAVPMQYMQASNYPHYSPIPETPEQTCQQEDDVLYSTRYSTSSRFPMRRGGYTGGRAYTGSRGSSSMGLEELNKEKFKCGNIYFFQEQF